MASPRDLARAHAIGRVALGAALTVAPRRVASAWLGPRHARRAQTAVVASAMGARDLGLGLGIARALGEGHGARPWLSAAVLADAVDLVATLRARDELPALGVASVAAMAGGSVAVGLWLRRAVD
ncbi:MAG: hypothetical protein M3P50_07920 [Actinomycetota bacterium]|nr:hypothetical protein [Actinomycetota bacterium]